MTPLVNFLSLIVALGILIFVHELGHFLFAKLARVGVETFSLGFGPRLFGFRRGETEYRLSALPLGGYVKMIGEGDDRELTPEEQRRSFAAKSPLTRIVIVAAGPFFNIVFAFVVYIFVFMHGIPVQTALVGQVDPTMPAAQAGIKGGDLITAVNGQPIRYWDEIAPHVMEGKGEMVTVTVQRKGEERSFTLKPVMVKEKTILDEDLTVPKIGVILGGQTVILRFPPGEAVTMAGANTGQLLRLISKVLVKMVKGELSLRKALSGPIRMAKIAGDQAREGAVNFLGILASLSINLGYLNLLPIPVLDGGHIAFTLWEIVFRRPVSPRAREIAQQVGLAIIVTLMFFAFYNDIFWLFTGK